MGCCVLAPSAPAKQELTVSPLILELDAEAGDTLTEDITATASGDEAIVVELVHADFGFSDADYGITLINDDAPETTAFSTRGWFSLPQDRYRIPAGRSRDLPLRIEVPSNTPGGTYLGAALLRVVPEDGTRPGSQVTAVTQSGPLVFIAVEGGDPPKPRVDTFELPRLQRSGPIEPRIRIDNEGDEFFTLEGTVSLSGPGRDDEVDVRRQFVVPDEPRDIKAAAEDGRSDEGPVRLGTSSLGLGRYTVTSRLRIEPTGTTLVSRRTVWVIPTWAWIVGTLLLLAVLVAASASIVRWRRRRAERAALLAEDLAAAPTTEAPADELRDEHPDELDADDDESADEGTDDEGTDDETPDDELEPLDELDDDADEDEFEDEYLDDDPDEDELS